MASQRRARSQSSGRLTYKPAPDEGPLPKTLQFIRTQLPAWRDDPQRPSDLSEKRLNSSLCDFLDRRSRFDLPMVRFKHEAPQTRTRTVDMGVHGVEEVTVVGSYNYTFYEPFLVIEAKRLPAPSRDREREYVSGTDKTSGTANGGIQRFKLGLHGDRVETAVIVGYVEELTLQHWYATINQWITDLIAETSSGDRDWTESDALEQLVCDNDQRMSSAMSIHRRSAACRTPSIRIHHFWVVMLPSIH